MLSLEEWSLRVLSGGTKPARAASGGALGVPSRREPLSPQRLREWYSRRGRVAAGATGGGAARGAGGATGATGGAGAAGGGASARAPGGAAGAGAAGGATGAGATGGTTGAGAAGGTGGATRATGGTGAAGGGAGAGAAGGATGAGAAGGATGATGGAAGTGGPGAEGTGSVSAVSGGATRPRPYYVLLLQQVLGSPPSPSPPPPFLSPPPVQSQSQLQAASPLPGPSPYSGPTRGLTERESLSLVLCRLSLVLRRLSVLFVLVSSVASALVAELVDFAAACRLDYAASLVADSASASVCPPSVGGECALGTDVVEDRQEDLECFAAASPHLVSMLLAPEGDPDALDIPTPRSYAEAIEDEVPPPGANIISSMWIFRVKRPPGSPPAFKARYVARGFSQRQGVDFFQTFSPTPKMTTLRVLLHVAAQRDYELHSLDFSTAFLQGSLHEEIWPRRPPGFTGSFLAGTQWSLRRPVYGLRQAPREWHDMLKTTLAALGFAPSTADPSLFLRTDATLPPFYVLVYVDDLVFATADTEALAHVKSELQKRHACTDLGELTIYLGLRITRDRAQRTITLTQSHMVQQILQRFGFTYSSPQSTPLPTGHSISAPPSDESVEPSGPYPELVGCLMYLMTCTRPDLAYPLSLLACYVAPGRHRKVHWDAAKRVLRYLCNTSGMGLVLGGRARVVLTGHADASWELRWLTYLLTDLGEAPRSPPVLYVDNKAMLALCQEHRLEHRTKHIALHYFLARELQQRGQLRLAYVASQANTADVFTKALQPCDHQRFLTVLGLQPFPSPGLTAAAATAVVAVPVRVPVCVHVTVPIAVPVAVPAALPASVPAACAASPSCAATTATAAATAVSYAKAGSFSAAAAAAAAIAAAVAAAALLTGGCALPLHGPSRRVGMGGGAEARVVQRRGCCFSHSHTTIKCFLLLLVLLLVLVLVTLLVPLLVICVLILLALQLALLLWLLLVLLMVVLVVMILARGCAAAAAATAAAATAGGAREHHLGRADTNHLRRMHQRLLPPRRNHPSLIRT
ncbi:unnamed protein product [Closterium sp. NIES-54]